MATNPSTFRQLNPLPSGSNDNENTPASAIMSEVPASPPPLPRYPTVLRDAMNETLPSDKITEEPLPHVAETAQVPRFPSLTDVGLGENVGEGAMNLRTEAGGKLETIPEYTTLSGLDKNREYTEVQHPSTLRRMNSAKTSTDSMLEEVGKRKVKNIYHSGGPDEEEEDNSSMGALQLSICKLPDPVLLFYIELLFVVSADLFASWLLRTWFMRVFIPLLFMSTIGAAALWRKTKVIPLRHHSMPDDMGVHNNSAIAKGTGKATPWSSFKRPNVKKIVTKGEKLRKRQAALKEREDAVRKGQIRLEAMRKEIEGRLPPTESVEGALKNAMRARSQNEAQEKVKSVSNSKSNSTSNLQN